MEKTKLGLAPNVEAALAYSLPPFSVISGIVLLVMEPESKFVRFHAMQAFILFAFYGILGAVIKFLPIINYPLTAILGVVVGLSWVVLIFQAFTGKYFRFPIIGDAIYEKVVGAK